MNDKAGSFIKDKDGKLKENLNDKAMKARADKAKEKDGAKK